MNELKLSDIKQGLPGVSSIEGDNLYENCMVELHRQSFFANLIAGDKP